MYLLNRGGIYYVEYFDNDKNKTVRRSTKKKTREEAVAYAAKTFPSFELKIKTEVKATAKVEPKLLSVFSMEYAKYIEKIYSKKYLTSVKLSFRMLLGFVGDKPISKITIRELDNFFMYKFSKSKFAAHLYLRTLKSAFNKAIAWELMDVNPLLKIKLGRLPRNNPIYLSEQELSMILQAATNPKLRDMIAFAFYTGMRLGEIINLKKDSIQLEEGIIRVRNTALHLTKGKSERYIPIAAKIRDIVFTWMRKPGVYLFTMNGTAPYKEDYLTKGFKKIITKLQLSNEIHFHTLRHSFASYLAIQGVSLYVVKELLGHKDISTTQIYAHLSKDSLKKAIDLF
jgi:site-specific recombinase XerD